MDLVQLVLAGTGALLVVLAVPLMRRRVRPNGWYGLRVAATFADERVWYEANARSGRDLFVLGVVQVLLATLLPWTGIGELAYVAVNTGVLLAGTIVFCVVGVRRANALLRVTERGRAQAPRNLP